MNVCVCMGGGGGGGCERVHVCVCGVLFILSVGSVYNVYNDDATICNSISKEV